VCEASAALVGPCPAAAASACLLVGDNEVRDRLFLYRLPGGRGPAGPDASSRRPVPLDVELSDIEALARTGDSGVIVYGSHSRNRHCKNRANRRLFVELRLTADGPARAVAPAVSTPVGVSGAELFGASPAGVLAQVAAAFTRAEQAAERGDCSQTLDIEGAVRVGDDVWLGLRRPLVDGHAAIVRHDPRQPSLRFEDARLLDLQGHGVRGLDLHEGFVYGLSGGALWRFPSSALASSAPIAVEPVADVSLHSEGVAIHDDHAIVVQDGKQGSTACKLDASYSVVPLQDEARPRR
jgi:hypothetical protein